MIKNVYGLIISTLLLTHAAHAYFQIGSVFKTIYTDIHPAASQAISNRLMQRDTINLNYIDIQFKFRMSEFLQLVKAERDSAKSNLDTQIDVRTRTAERREALVQAHILSRAEMKVSQETHKLNSGISSFKTNDQSEALNLAKSQLREINSITKDAETILPSVSSRMGRQPYIFITFKLNECRSSGKQAVELAQAGAKASTIHLVSDLARDTALSIQAYLTGLANGTIAEFQSLRDTAHAIYQNPELISRISKNVINYLTSDAVIKDLKYLTSRQFPADIHSAFVEYQIHLASLSTEEMAKELGHAQGHLASNLLLCMAGTEAIQAGRAALQTSALALEKAAVLDQVGAQVVDVVSKTKALAPGIESSEVLGKKIVDSAASLGIRTKEAFKDLFDVSKYVGNEIGAVGDGVSDLIKAAGKATQPVANIREFFTSNFGNVLKGASERTSKLFQGQKIHIVTENLTDFKCLKKGDLYYLDGLHKDHLEVFTGKGKFKQVLNLDGTINIEKTAKAIGRSINVD